MHFFEVPAHLFHPRHSNNHRPLLLHPKGFFLLLLLTLVFKMSLSSFRTVVPQSGDILGFSSSITAGDVVELTNAERAKTGTAPLVINSKLSEAAMAKAKDMFADQYWAHYSPTGKTPWDFMKKVEYKYTVAGENLARDFMEPEEMVQAWMSSPSHKQNILNPRYKEIGIAVVDGVLKGSETTLVVQMFGSTTTTRTVGAVPSIAPRPVASAPPRNPRALSATEEDSYDNSTESLAQAEPTPVFFQQGVEYLENIETPPLFSPLHITKAVFLAMILLVLSVLIYDSVIITQLNTVRFVGKNFAHIALFLTILFLIIFFKGGVVGA